MVNYHWFPSDFVKWSYWFRETIIDFPQTLTLGHAGYGYISLISIRLCHLVILVMGNYHWFPSYFVTWSCCLREIIIDFPQTLALIMLVMVNDHWFPSDFVTCSCWLWLIIIDFHQTLSLGYVGYGKLSPIFLRIVTWSCWLWEIIIDFPQTLSLGYSFPSDFVTWSSWVWLIIIDFPQTLSSGHVGYGKLSLISLILYHVVMLVKGNYHWFPSDFATWSCWLRKIIIDFPQTLLLGLAG